MNTTFKTNPLKIQSTFLFLLYILLLGWTQSAQAQSDSDHIIGKWTNEKKDANFQISKQGSTYFGKVIGGTGKEPKDVKNPDPKLRNRDIIGLVILNGFVFDGKKTWENGTIYDPREGKTYSCKITVKNKDQINVRGYLGVSLFGRTEIWTRIK